MRLAHIMEGNMLCSGTTDVNVTLIENTFTKISRIMFDQISGYSSQIDIYT